VGALQGRHLVGEDLHRDDGEQRREGFGDGG
jgi:hypothetical protein